MRRVRNAYRIAAHWWHEYRWYRAQVWHDMTRRQCAARAWADTRECIIVGDNGLVFWLPF
jgi:hypothetical protein